MSRWSKSYIRRPRVLTQRAVGIVPAPMPFFRSKTKSHGRIAGILRVLGVNAALILLGLVLLELIFGNWFMPYVPPDPQMFDRKWVYQQELYEPPSKVVIIRDRYGLRGLHAPISSLDIVTVGGSTTNQKFITEGQTWQDVIHSLTGLVIANAGIEGLSSYNHGIAVEDWLHKVPNLHPKYYLHFLGVNDAVLPSRRRLRTGSTSWSRWLKPRSAILQAAAKLRTAFADPILVNHGVTVPARNTAGKWIRAVADQNKIANYVERSYKPNLRALLDLHTRANEKAIFVTQPANPLVVKVENGVVFVTNPGLGEWAVALHEINSATGKVCRERPVSCRFIDLATDLPMDPTDFYDLVHYTPKGARVIGRFLADALAFVRPAQRTTAASKR